VPLNLNGQSQEMNSWFLNRKLENIDNDPHQSVIENLLVIPLLKKIYKHSQQR